MLAFAGISSVYQIYKSSCVTGIINKMRSCSPHIVHLGIAVMLERVKQRIPMPDYMAEQMPELMPKVMDNLMPHMINDLVPLVTQPMIDHLKKR